MVRQRRAMIPSFSLKFLVPLFLGQVNLILKLPMKMENGN